MSYNAFGDAKGHNAHGYGTAAIVATDPKFGQSCLELDGSGNVTIDAHPDLNPGLLDLCLEFWANTPTPGGTRILVTQAPPATPAGIWLAQTSTEIQVWVANGESWGVQALNAPVPSYADWFHVALVRHAALWTLYVNGQPGQSPQSVSVQIPDGLPFYFGGHPDQMPNGSAIGRFQELAISIGDAVHHAPFTPPTSPYA